jgi:hypothetical protein
MKLCLRSSVGLMVLLLQCGLAVAEPHAVIDVGSRRELFVDQLLIQKMTNAELRLHRPIDRGPVLKFDEPWEGPFSAYVTVIHNAGRYQLYYRGLTKVSGTEATCYAESNDGITWTKPPLDLFTVPGSKAPNIILSGVGEVTHNFSPFLDTSPHSKPEHRFKAIGGSQRTGLFAYTSADGIHWRKLSDEPVLKAEQTRHKSVFDSQNVAFWSQSESKYLLYYRVYQDRKRRIARVESDDFLNWHNPTLMEYRVGDAPAPVEELYTSQTHPYFRAPHIYISTAARFMLGRRVLTTQQAKAIAVDPKYFHDTSDAIFMTSRGGNVYQRTFMEAFIIAGIGAENWVSRTNYPALNIVQTSPIEMSLYVNQNYGQPTAHLRRYTLRLDGFASLHTGYDRGEILTKPLRFEGSQLLLNFATSAAGGIRVEIQDTSGTPLPGFSLADCTELIGNEINRPVSWRGGNLPDLAKQSVRLRFEMKDAELYALQFQP